VHLISGSEGSRFRRDKLKKTLAGCSIIPYLLTPSCEQTILLTDMTAIFEAANSSFLRGETDHILTGVSERSLCGSLMLHISKALEATTYNNYFVDIEYNRNKDGKLKTIINGNETHIKICCDLIVHSRGKFISQDNLIAVEMKRNTHPKSEKDKDKFRLKCLTRDSFDDLWSFDGTALPNHVCRYVLGVFYELNITERKVKIHYYAKGKQFKEYLLMF
jgi:hypothetical protein